MNKINLDAIAQEPIQGHTSKGDQPKWQLNGEWYKADHMGYEALAEVLVSELLGRSNVTSFVAYKPVWIEHGGKTFPGCVSKNFRAKDEMLVPFERLHRAYQGGHGLSETIAAMPDAAARIRYTVDFIEQTTGLTGVGPYLTTLLEIDAFFLNEDRHTNNLAVIRDERSGKFRLCPVFDNGLALLSDLNDYSLDADIYSCIDRVRAKPFSLDFDEQVEAANELYGSFLKFTFTKQDVRSILESAETFYPETILRRVQSIVFEQMRKYSIFF